MPTQTAASCPIAASISQFIRFRLAICRRSRIGRNISACRAVALNLCRQPFAPFQKLLLTGPLPPFLRPVLCARPKPENRTTPEIVTDFQINHHVPDHVTRYFDAEPKAEDLALP